MKLRKTLLLSVVVGFIFSACSKTESISNENTTCFTGDIEIVGNNTLSESSKLYAVWGNFNDNALFIFGKSEININDKTFEICFDKTEIPENFTNFWNTSTPNDIDNFYFSLANLFVTNDESIENGSYNGEKWDDIKDAAIGWSSDIIVYTEQEFRAWADENTDESFLSGNEVGFSLGQCDDNPNSSFDDIVPADRNTLKIHIGTDEQLEDAGIEVDCNWT